MQNEIVRDVWVKIYNDKLARFAFTVLYGYLNENFQREYNNIFHMFSCGKKNDRDSNPRPLRLLSNEPLQPRQPCIEPLVTML